MRRAPFLVVLIALLGACGSSGGGSGANRPTVSSTLLPRPSVSTPGSTSAPPTTAGAPATTVAPEAPTLPVRTTTVPITADPPTTTTDAPVTTTTPPTTVPRTTTTVQQTTTTPTTSAATTTSSASTSTTSTTVAAAAASSGGGTPTWAWIVIIVGLIGLALVAIALLLRSRAHKRQSAAWRDRARASVADAKVARDLLTGAVGTTDATRLAEVRQQADTTAAALEALGSSAPTDSSGAAATSVAQALRSYGFALEAERLLRDGATPPSAAELEQADATRRGHAQSLDNAIAQLDAIAGPAQPTGTNPTV